MMKHQVRASCRLRLVTITGALLLSAPLALTACSTPAGSIDAGEGSQESISNHTVSLSNGWAKAAEGMSGVFGTLENHSESPVQVVGAMSDIADLVELHETVTSGSTATMQEAEGGFEIPAGGTYELDPGGDHIMLMEMPEAILAGDEITITLSLDTGETTELTVLVKDFAGAEENYEGESSDGHGEEHAEH